MIIGLCGIKGSGKSVVAKYLEDKYGFIRLNFKDELIRHIKLRFPDTLKELCKIYDMSIDELFEKKPPAHRALMVNIGTDDKRRDNPNHWVDSWLNSLAMRSSKNVVADDVRFQNEFDAIKLQGGIVIRVVRSDIKDGGDHPSETEQFNFNEDFTIFAEPGDHDAVYRSVDSIIQDLLAD